MPFVKVEVRKATGRPSADVRVMAMEVRGTRQIGVIMAAGVLGSAGWKLGDELDLLRGEGDDAGWVRVVPASGRDGRLIGRLPQTDSGIARFTLPPEWALPPIGSTDVEDYRVEPGALTLLLPAKLRGGAVSASAQPAPVAAAAPLPPVAPPPLVEAPLKWTPARNDVLRSMYPQGASGEAMAEAVNRLPESEPATPKQCLAQAGNLNLKRPPAPIGLRGPDRGASLPAASPMKDEAMKMFADGHTGRDVAAELGVPLSDAANWAAEYRLKNRKTGEAA